MDTDRKRTRIDAKLKALATAQVPRKAESATPEPIAIVGIAGFFPQCASVAEFWNAIDQDRSLLEEVPIDRFDVDEVFCPGEIREGKTRSKWGGFIPNIRQFDASYFGILPDEAERMDPRQRLLLMAVRQALVDAGYRPDALRGTKTGVFVGAEHNEYAQCMADADVDVGTGLHQSDSMLANGLSYFFDLRGPSESVNAMCAGGAVALHRAVVAMRAGEIDQAVVGAANLILKPDIAIKLSQSGQMSPIGTVKSFGADADGFLCGEGVCAMLLKPLGRAQADGDAIHALIRHTAVNYNGQGSSSIAAPSVAVHSQLIQTCYRQAGVDPRDVRYIEAQGMGNPASDIAEWDAFNHALKTLADEKGAKLPEGNCYVSTLKPLSGHLHAASALAAICKVVRSFRTGMIQGVLGFDTINPHLTLGGMPCRIAEQSDAWPSGRERIAGVHSFGAGGNNAHILIEAYHEPAEEQSEQTGDMILPVSAPTPQLLEQAVFALRAKVAAHAEYPLWRIALTLSHGRETFASRVVFVAASREEWLSQSEAFLKGEACSGVWLQDATTENNDVRLSEQGMALRWLVGEEVAWPAPEQHGPWRVHLPAAPLDTQPYWFSSCSSRTRDDASISVSDLGARTWAEQVVRTALGALLRRPGQELDLNAELSEMGFDSLMVRHLCRRMRDDHGVEIEPALLFELTRPVRLVEWLANRGHPSRASSPKRAPRPMRPCLIKGGREPIAIIGLAGVYPKAANVDKLWRNLVAGLDCIDELPTERWATSHFFEPDPARAVERGLSYGKWGGFLEDLHAFDPLFFYLSHAEAQYMHPKERLFMQCAWHALEDAGYPPGALATEKVGVFVGVSKAGYDNYRDSFFSVANRVSYRFNFTGPSMPVDTACSSSLSAIHEACLHLQSGECDLALAGGVNAYTHPSTFAEFSRLGVMSPDGKSRAFGDGANGFVPGEGVGAVLLKPLERALEDGDHIHGVILGSAINHGGKTNGYTVPNPEAHRLLIRQALTRSGISASAIGYVEAHGTGTALGDPIELRGLTEAFLEDGVEVGACRLGSVKTNIGHLEAAAGIAGLTKILLQMRHRQFVPSLHSSTLNPDIVWHASPFRVQQRVEAWDALPADHSHSPRIAGLSSFGAGGSNAHLIVQEAPDDTRPKSPDQGRRLFVLSARNEAALRRYVDSLLNFIESGVPVSLTDLTYTLQIGREAMQWRLACVAESLEALASDLRGFISGAPGHGVQVGKIKRVEQRLGAFSVDEDAHRLARQWFDQGKLHYLAKLWLDGEELDWRALYQGGDARRISLPGYPFDKEVIPPAPMVSPIGVGEVRDLTLTSTGTLTDGGGLGTLLVKPRWQPAALRRGGWRGPVRVVCCELRGADEVPGWLKLPGEERGIAERFKAHSISISETLRHIIKDGARTSTLVQLLIPSRHRWLCGLSGLLKTASLESSRIQAQLIEVPEGMAGAELADVATRAAQLDETWLRHDGSGFSALRWDDIRLLGTSNLPPWKDDGVYLLTGGLGGLARLFAEDIAQHARRVTLVLVGRSPLSERHAQWLKVLNASGVCAIYQQADIANAAEAECLVADIESLKGALTGVLHCAGVQRDAFIINSRPEDWHSVMAPKTEGIVNLDRATRHCRLDCFIVFSSASAAVGHPGQAGYAAANGFMDGFVEERQALVAAGERHGRTVAIDWGLWRDGGMQVSAEVERMLQDGSGMIPLSRESGLCACYDALASGDCRVLVIEGDVARLRRTLSGTATGKLASPARGEMRQVLWSALSEVLGISPDNIDEQADFESVGLDQPAFNRMLSELGLHYALELSPLLYRECRTIAELEHHMAARLGYMDGTTAPGVEKGNASERAAEYLKNLLSSVIQLPEHRIDADEPFERYGIDSLMVMKMTAKLEETFGCLPKTLFYEYQNIRELSHYFAEKHGNILAEQTRVPECALPSASVASAEPTRQGAALPDEAGGGDIAIIGLAGRYPGAENLGDFWRVLNEGCDCITEIPAERWDHAHYFDPDRNAAGKTYTKWGGFIEGVDCFDAAFFNISPREAAIMEPQERLFLQTAYEAIEDAGYTRQSLASNATIHGVAGSVGVFVGVTYEEYQLYAAEATARGEPMVLSMSPSSIANRVSYFCNFHGPSMAVDAMCASSLTTVHLACQSLKNGECRVALAGGVNVSIHPAKYLMLGKGKFASSKGRCESFGAGGDGYVPSEGVGAVLLKPLGAALADKDRIYGVIRGSAINHGGKTNGYAVPNPNAQADVVARAIANAAVDARQISYVEAHGTGTVLGDPIEIAGISKAYRAHTQDSGFCAIGSVKSNIGHCESAAGIAGLTKVLLQMKYRKLVPSLHAHTLNANINFDSTPFKVQQTLTEWAPRSTSGESLPLIAGVSSFGAGGTNAHLIVAEWPQTRAVSIDSPREPVAIVLSAKNAEALRVQAERMAAWIRAHEAEGFDVRAMAYTLQVGREAMDHRLAFLAENVAQVMASIDAFLHGGAATTGLRFGQAREGQPTPTAAARSSLEQSAWSRDLPTLLRHWVDGGEVPWSLLYDGEPPARLSLPTYPFSRQRYWLPKRTVSAGLGVTLCQDGTATAPGKIKLRPLHTLADTPAAPSRQAAASSVPTGGMASKDEAVAPMPQLDVESMLTAWLADVLYMSAGDISQDKPFIDLGLDSVVGAEWIRSVNKHLGLALPSSVAYEHSTIKRLARHVQSLMAGQAPSAAVAKTAPAVMSAVHPRESDRSGTLSRLEQMLSASLADVLYMSAGDIPQDKPFIDLGLDSVVGAEWMRTVNKNLGLALPASVVYEQATIRQLARYLHGQGAGNVPVGASAADAVPVAAPAALVDESTRSETLSRLERMLSASLADVLYMSAGDIPQDKSFIDLGLDSVVGAEWMRTVNKSLGLALPASVVYEQATIRQLARYLHGQGAGNVPVGASAADAVPVAAPAALVDESTRSETLSRLEQMLSASLADVLYMSAGDIPQDKPFIDLGLDSVVGAEWMRTVNKSLGLALPVSVVYEYVTIRRLARHLYDQGAGGEPEPFVAVQAWRLSSAPENQGESELDAILAQVRSGELEIGVAQKLIDDVLQKIG